jgi:N-acetylglutamate synthase-like GNAT family acetyltransferase
MNGVRVRQAAESDWPAIASLLEAGRLPLDGARDYLNSFRVAEQGGQLVGCAGIEDHGSAALLRSVAVSASVRGRGVGNALVEAILDNAAACGIAEICLLTTTAEKYFEQRGFHRDAITNAPPALRASAEFQGACPASAVFMRRALTRSAVREQTPA